MTTRVFIPILCLGLFATAHADLVWTGTTDAVSFFNEGNWLDNSNATPAAGTIDPGLAITANTGGTIRIDSGSGTPNVVGGNIDIGLGNDLVIGGGKEVTTTSTFGLRVNGANAGVGPLQNVLVADGSILDVQFVLELSVTLTNGSRLQFRGGGNPVNETLVNVTGLNNVVQFTAETFGNFQSEHLSKFTFEGNPLVFGSDPLLAEPGDNAIALAYNGASGVQIEFLGAVVPEPASLAYLMFGALIFRFTKRG